MEKNEFFMLAAEVLNDANKRWYTEESWKVMTFDYGLTVIVEWEAKGYTLGVHMNTDKDGVEHFYLQTDVEDPCGYSFSFSEELPKYEPTKSWEIYLLGVTELEDAMRAYSKRMYPND